MQTVHDSYPDGNCPDCGEPISEDAMPGDECSSCGFVFWGEGDDGTSSGNDLEKD